MKALKKLSIALLLGSVIATPTVVDLTTVTAVQQATQSQRLLSLGASLNAQEAEQTKGLLGANQGTLNKMIYVDGNTINHYLNDGSNANTGVFSSALIETLPQGSGVQVQIVTPQNINVVKPTTYQNAAITSGAKDVLIKIATVKPVTGEGALAGVYALLEQTGMRVDPKSIVVAEKEIKLVEQAKQENQVTDSQINQVIVEIKTEITNHIVNQQTINIEQIINQIITQHNDIHLSQDTIKVLNQLAEEYQQTEAAQNKDTVEQLNQSIKVDTDKPYAVDLNQFGGIVHFYRDGMNIPTHFTVDLPTLKRYQGENNDGTDIIVEDIETKEISVVADDGSTRNVKVNTRIKDAQAADDSNDMYLFFNNEGTISLLTPNFAGNGENAMLEYVVGEAPTIVATEFIEDNNSIEDYPYIVDPNLLDSVTPFYTEGMNVPNNISLSLQDASIQFKFPYTEEPINGSIQLVTIPTKEIRIRSHDNSGVRNVKVNTALQIQGIEGDLANECYLFINQYGEVSLATPNYAGNVLPADADIMLEYRIGTYVAPEGIESSVSIPSAPVDAPYAVDLSLLPQDTVFSSETNTIELQLLKDENKIIIQDELNNYEGKISFETIETQEIEIQSADGSGKRKVKVNNLIKIENLNDNQQTFYKQDLYLFLNAQNKLSLVVPDYSKITQHNVENSELEYIEYLIKEQ